MTRKWKELTDEFDAESEDGQSFHVLIYTTMIDASTISGGYAAPVEGIKTARTSNGQHCNRIDDDNFKIVELGLRIKRVS